MIWMAVDIDVHSNGKVLALAERLDVSADEAVGVLVRLWAHAMRNSDRAGKLKHSSPAVFAEVFRQPRDRAKDIVDLLAELEFLEKRDGAYFVHGWEERQAAWYSFKEKKEYNKRRYKSGKQKQESDSEHIQGRISLDSDNNHTVPNQTLPYLTVPDPTQPDREGGCAPSGSGASAPSVAAAPGGPPFPVSKTPCPPEKLITDVYDLYNELCPSLPRLVKPTPARGNAVLYATKHKGLSMIYDAFAKAENTPFLKGENQRGWKADFDWLLHGDNMEHVLEGRYDRSENCTGDTDMDRTFSNQHAYTKEQFEAMKTDIFDLKDL